MHQPYIKMIPHSKNAIIFIHGFIGTPDHFTRFYDLVPENFSIYNILLDGHGGSVKNFSKTSMKKWQAQVKQVIDQVKNNHENIYLVGHSMGTLLEIQYALLYPSQIKKMFLLAVPLHVHITPLAFTNALGTVFDVNDKNNPQLQAAKAMYSVDRDPRVYQYIQWIPRYFELLKLCKWTRNMVSQLNTKTIVIQSKKDELVQLRSKHYFENNESIEVMLLRHSTHYFYTSEDEKILFSKFETFIS